MAWTYEKAGVSLERSDAWIDFLRKIAPRAGSPNIRSGIGGFAGLYDLGDGKILAACADGVGTKLEVARAVGKYSGLGQDLVAMNVNDLVTCGAKPLFFLDYIACGYLDPNVFGPVIEGIADACSSSGCALLGGETAEMPDVYVDGTFDLAGFAVGIADESALVEGTSISEGDVFLGLKSSGIHSNGFSLARKCLFGGEDPLPLDMPLPGTEEALSDNLLTPTRLYVKQALLAASTGRVKGMAHITGGGMEENIQRILPGPMKPVINYSAWKMPPVFEIIAGRGVPSEEMRRVFNLGIGFVLVTDARDAGRLVDLLYSEAGEEAIEIGEVGR
jgi:phosphoribosylformylglycinamidine cyclo-ligase